MGFPFSFFSDLLLFLSFLSSLFFSFRMGKFIVRIAIPEDLQMSVGGVIKI